jgi:hypothetical protein
MSARQDPQPVPAPVSRPTLSMLACLVLPMAARIWLRPTLRHAHTQAPGSSCPADEQPKALLRGLELTAELSSDMIARRRHRAGSDEQGRQPARAIEERRPERRLGL